ncbi:aldo/keto reductase [Sciscionella sediminilitoris]|uniref:aldo/keto reductase n=1 Tax=Sciscionella sediminilitoris TaxID=1445613 RepID=UPI0004DEF42E|nr:aldo/keto reductase [Sciscionella sp. SE31]
MDRFAIGLAALGRPAYLNLGREGALPADRTVEAMRSATFAVLDEAYAAGVRWVDAARSYGLAEEFLASWLGERGHRDVTVSSKWGYTYVGGWRRTAEVHEVKEHSLTRLREQLAETRKLLGDRLDLYQVHSLTVDSPLFGDPGVLGALADLAAEGVRLGFSTSGPRQADAVRRGLALEVDGTRLFTAVQSTWNLLEPSVGPALAEAHDSGALVLVKEPLANGRLAVDPPEPVRAAAEREHTDPDVIALSAALARPWADRVLLGPASTGQLTSNLRAAGLGADLREDLAEDPERYWSQRAELTWT